MLLDTLAASLLGNVASSFKKIWNSKLLSKWCATKFKEQI